jgi:hypothetical protein
MDRVKKYFVVPDHLYKNLNMKNGRPSPAIQKIKKKKPKTKPKKKMLSRTELINKTNQMSNKRDTSRGISTVSYMRQPKIYVSDVEKLITEVADMGLLDFRQRQLLLKGKLLHNGSIEKIVSFLESQKNFDPKSWRAIKVVVEAIRKSRLDISKIPNLSVVNFLSSSALKKTQTPFFEPIEEEEEYQDAVQKSGWMSLK